MVAYSSGSFERGLAVHCISVKGGSPTQLTFHPGSDMQGWRPDGEAILFSSARDSQTQRHTRFFTIPRTGGYPSLLLLPMAARRLFTRWHQNRLHGVAGGFSHLEALPRWADGQDLDR
ncbi:MAG: hypothetical protein R2867_44920 [Caldilineaceae bacterium]